MVSRKRPQSAAERSKNQRYQKSRSGGSVAQRLSAVTSITAWRRPQTAKERQHLETNGGGDIGLGRYAGSAKRRNRRRRVAHEAAGGWRVSGDCSRRQKL